MWFTVDSNPSRAGNGYFDKNVLEVPVIASSSRNGSPKSGANRTRWEATLTSSEGRLVFEAERVLTRVGLAHRSS